MYKIGLVLDDSLDVPDGVQQYVLTLGAWLTNQGHEVHYLVGQTERTDIAHIHSLSKNIQVRFNGNGMRIPLPTSRRRLKAFLLREQFDVLHVQMPYSPFLAGRLIKDAPARTAVVGTFHILPYGMVSTLGNRLLAWWLRSTLRRFTAVCAVSPAAASYARRVYRVRASVVPNAVPLRQFQLAPIAHDVPCVLYLGRLVPRKGCQLLLEALTKVSYNKPYEVIIAGRGPLRAQLEQYAHMHNLKQVRFVGFIAEADKATLFASADIAVFPSSGGESFGIVLVEAMASGSAVVLGGNNPGYASVLGDWPDQLINTSDAAQLARKIDYLLAHPVERRIIASDMARSARQYDSNLVGPRITAMYENALRRSNPHV